MDGSAPFLASTQNARYVPKEEQAWFDGNRATHHCLNAKAGIDDTANGVTLRSDVHLCFDRGGFVFYPINALTREYLVYSLSNVKAGSNQSSASYMEGYDEKQWEEGWKERFPNFSQEVEDPPDTWVQSHPDTVRIGRLAAAYKAKNPQIALSSDGSKLHDCDDSVDAVDLRSPRRMGTRAVDSGARS